VVLAGALGLLAGVLPATAQPLGTFRWQLQPYCNVATLAVTQSGAHYTLDGSDDQCGAAQLAGVIGTAFLNPDGSIGIGLTTVLTPGGAPVHVNARITLSSLSGDWQDSAGNSGAFVFTPGPGVGGAPRPVAPNGILLGSITATQVAPGVVGGGQINPNQVQARVSGTCPIGQHLRGIHANGTVLCEPLLIPNVSTTLDDPVNSVGSFTSIAIGHDGLPVVSHWDNSAAGLRVTKCADVACAVAMASTIVDDPANNVGSYTSIAIGADGRPVISHLDATASALRVTKCGNAQCTAFNDSYLVDDPSNAVGQYTSIAIGADGLPVISYRDVTAGALRVAKCIDAACSPSVSHVVTTVHDPINSVGWYSSIAVPPDGLPVIAHQDATAGALLVTKCSNGACTASTTAVVNPFGNEGSFASMPIGVDGFPVISHHNATFNTLLVTKCANATCTTAATRTVDQPGYAVGSHTSLAIGADGLPIVSHFSTTGRLRVTHCGNAACGAGNVSTTVDDAVFVGGFTSIAIGHDGLPVISYRDATAGALRITKCGTPSCQW
jgi:hypothetical protein